ncbi:MAG: CHAD domain-containing protein [Bryobacteraceae bacterium]
MAYRLKSGEPVPAGIQRVVLEEIASAAGQLSGKPKTGRDERIHEARKSVKKIRGVLRMMRPELGDIYRTESTRMRDVGRKLSQFRDAGAIIETFDALREKYRGELGRRTLASIRRGLMARKKQAEKKADVERVLRRMAAKLLLEQKRVQAWPLAAVGFPAIAPGLEETYRRGRNAMAAVRKRSSAENYHEWRKRVKDHWYHFRLLESLWTDAMQAYEKSLKDLETCLGEDHNLVILREKVLADPAFYGSDEEVGLLAGLIGQYHKELRGNALSLGARIYEEKPREFTRRMQHLWEVWEAQPKSEPNP